MRVLRGIWLVIKSLFIALFKVLKWLVTTILGKFISILIFLIVLYFVLKFGFDIPI